MKTFLLRSVLCLAAVLGLATLASAQVVVTRYGGPVYVPAPAPITTYYAPSPVTTYYSPPVTTYYAPAAPVTTYYAPTTTYYAPTTAYYAPAMAPAVVYRPNPFFFPRRRVVVAPYAAPYYIP